MKPIPTSMVAKIRGTDRSIHVTDEAGTLAVGTTKQGSPLTVSYEVGSVLLVEGEGKVIVGPIDSHAVGDLAAAVASGDARALTAPQTSLILATYVLALSQAVVGLSASLQEAIRDKAD